MVWSHPHDGQFYLVLAVALAGFLIVAFAFVGSRRARSYALVALRGAALGVLVVILLNPTSVERVIHQGPQPAALFLLDESRSMSLESPTSRSKAAQEMIRFADNRVPPDRRPAIQKYGFGRDLVAIPAGDQVRRADADETRLGARLEQLPDRFGEAVPFGVFVFSDGRSTEPEALDRNGPGVSALGVPVHVVPLGDERFSGDVAIQDVDAPARRGPGRASAPCDPAQPR